MGVRRGVSSRLAPCMLLPAPSRGMEGVQGVRGGLSFFPSALPSFSSGVGYLGILYAYHLVGAFSSALPSPTPSIHLCCARS